MSMLYCSTQSLLLQPPRELHRISSRRRTLFEPLPASSIDDVSIIEWDISAGHKNFRRQKDASYKCLKGLQSFDVRYEYSMVLSSPLPQRQPQLSKSSSVWWQSILQYKYGDPNWRNPILAYSASYVSWIANFCCHLLHLCITRLGLRWEQRRSSVVTPALVHTTRKNGAKPLSANAMNSATSSIKTPLKERSHQTYLDLYSETDPAYSKEVL